MLSSLTTGLNMLDQHSCPVCAVARCTSAKCCHVSDCIQPRGRSDLLGLTPVLAMPVVYRCTTNVWSSKLAVMVKLVYLHIPLTWHTGTSIFCCSHRHVLLCTLAWVGLAVASLVGAFTGGQQVRGLSQHHTGGPHASPTRRTFPATCRLLQTPLNYKRPIALMQSMWVPPSQSCHGTLCSCCGLAAGWWRPWVLCMELHHR